MNSFGSSGNPVNPFCRLYNDPIFPTTQRNFHWKVRLVKSNELIEWASFHQIHRSGDDYGFLFYIHKEKSSTVATPRTLSRAMG